MSSFEKGKEFISSFGQTLKNVSDTAKQSADKLKNYAAENSLQVRRFSETKAIYAAWENTVKENESRTQLYQSLFSRTLAENQRLIAEANDSLRNYYELNSFLSIDSDEKLRQVNCFSQRYKDAPPRFLKKTLALRSAAGAAAAGTAAYTGALGLMTLLGSASTGTALSSLTGAAYWNATLAAFGGGSLATGGLGIAGGTVVLGGLVALPALAGGYLLAEHYTEKAYKEALKLKRDTLTFRQDAENYYSACETQLGFLQRINYGLATMLSFFGNLQNMTFAAVSIPAREDYFPVYQQAARTLCLYSELSPITAHDELNIVLSTELDKAEAAFAETQEAYYDFRARMSPAYRQLLDELAAQEQLVSEAKLHEATIKNLEQKLAEEKQAAEEMISALCKEKQQLRHKAEKNDAVREKLAVLSSKQSAIEKKYLFREAKYKKEIARQEKELRQSEDRLQKEMAARQKEQNDAAQLRLQYDSLLQEQQESFLGEREAFRKQYSELEFNYYQFDKDILHALASGEYLLRLNKEQRLDFSAIAICYAIALEGILQKILKWHAVSLPPEANPKNITLGSYCHFSDALADLFVPEFFRILWQLTDIRNDAAHYGKVITPDMIDKARYLLFDTTAIKGYTGLLSYLNQLLE